MSAAGPLRAVWDALEAGGWDPSGADHDFRARCPAHAGDNRSLRVSEGADGRAVVYCYAHQCEPKEIREALGMRMGEFFPVGHPKASSVPEREATPRRGVAVRVASILAGLDDLREPYVFQVFCRCQVCGWDGGWLRAHSGCEGRIDCRNGCRTRSFTQGLAGRVGLEAEKPKRRRSRVR